MILVLAEYPGFSLSSISPHTAIHLQSRQCEVLERISVGKQPSGCLVER